MLLRLALAVAMLLMLSSRADAQVASRLRVLTEDASASQCVAGICSTLQVSRSTFSTGGVETILFFSVNDTAGNPLPSPFPFPFNQIPNEAFEMNRHGTRASLHYGEANVTWETTGRFSEVSDLTTRVIDNRHPEFRVEHFRLTERDHLLEAATQGFVGPYTFEPDSSDPGNGFLRLLRTIRIDRQ